MFDFTYLIALQCPFMQQLPLTADFSSLTLLFNDSANKINYRIHWNCGPDHCRNKKRQRGKKKWRETRVNEFLFTFQLLLLPFGFVTYAKHANVAALFIAHPMYIFICCLTVIFFFILALLFFLYLKLTIEKNTSSPQKTANSLGKSGLW